LHVQVYCVHMPESRADLASFLSYCAMAPKRRDSRGPQCLAVYCNARLGKSVTYDQDGNVTSETYVPTICVPSNEKEEGFGMDHRFQVLLGLFAGVDEKEAGWRAEDRARELCDQRDSGGLLVKHQFCRSHMAECDIEMRGGSGRQWRILPGRVPRKPTLAAEATAQARADQLHSRVEGVTTRSGTPARGADGAPPRKKQKLIEPVVHGPASVVPEELSRKELIARVREYEAYIDEVLAAKVAAEAKVTEAAVQLREREEKFNALANDLAAARKENQRLLKDAEVCCWRAASLYKHVCVCVCVCACM
jgi:hypothetical protein